MHNEIVLLSRRIEQDESNARLYISRGEAHRLHGDAALAIADFTTALRIDPDNVAAATGLGKTWLDQGDVHRASAALNTALAKDPDNVRARVLRAKASRQAGKPLAAAADYHRAIAGFEPNHRPRPGYYLELARAYVAAGEPHFDSALASLDEGLRVLGPLRTLQLYAVEIDTRRGHFDAAIRRLDVMLAGASRTESLLLARGDVLTAAGRLTEADNDYRAALAAVEALPAQRKHTRLMQQLQADLNVRLASNDND